jgi:hypothetical protein
MTVYIYMTIGNPIFKRGIPFISQIFGRNRSSWIYNYLCNQCLSPLMLWVQILIRARCATLCNKVCQWLATGRWFSPGPKYKIQKGNVPFAQYGQKCVNSVLLCRQRHLVRMDSVTLVLNPIRSRPRRPPYIIVVMVHCH